MDFAWYVVGYFVVGVALFMSFWRWAARDDDGDGFFSICLLLIWPIAAGVFVSVGSYYLLKKIAKIGVKK